MKVADSAAHLGRTALDHAGQRWQFPPDTTRRNFLCWSAAVGISSLSSRFSLPGSDVSSALAADEDRLLDEIEARACRYFYEQADSVTGLVRDRAVSEGPDRRHVASIAATGFGLSALAIADRRGYLEPGAARARAERTVAYLRSRVPHKRGFFYHFLDMRTGRRAWRSEISSVDTAWLLCGLLHCRFHFDSPRMRRLASEILDRVDWRWMLNGGETLCHGWTPERGFLPYRWDEYSELLAMYLLAIGSSGSPIPVSCWDAWARPIRTTSELTFIHAAAPLFAHQYSHAWFDFRDRRDRYADYFRNSQAATLAHREYCIALAKRFPWYGPEMWGVTASDSTRGYRVWGFPSSPPDDGTLVPCAAGGSIPFLPRNCTAVLRNMLRRYGGRVWGRYGFVDAFQPDLEWYSRDVIGIDQGIMLLMAENARSGKVWEAVMSAPETRRAMQAVGLVRA